MIQASKSHCFRRRMYYRYLELYVLFLYGFGLLFADLDLLLVKGRDVRWLDVWILATSFIAIIFFFIVLRKRVERGVESSDLEIGEEGFKVFDGLFKHNIYWKDIHKIEKGNKYFIEWNLNAELRNQKRYPRGWWKNFMFKKLTSRKGIVFSDFKEKNKIEKLMLRYFNTYKRNGLNRSKI